MCPERVCACLGSERLGSDQEGRPVQHIDGQAHSEVIVARYVSLTFPEPGKIILKIGPGDHTCQTFELARDHLRGLVLDGLPTLLLK